MKHTHTSHEETLFQTKAECVLLVCFSSPCGFQQVSLRTSELGIHLENLASVSLSNTSAVRRLSPHGDDGVFSHFKHAKYRNTDARQPRRRCRVSKTAARVKLFPKQTQWELEQTQTGSATGARARQTRVNLFRMFALR